MKKWKGTHLHLKKVETKKVHGTMWKQRWKRWMKKWMIMIIRKAFTVVPGRTSRVPVLLWLMRPFSNLIIIMVIVGIINMVIVGIIIMDMVKIIIIVIVIITRLIVYCLNGMAGGVSKRPSSPISSSGSSTSSTSDHQYHHQDGEVYCLNNMVGGLRGEYSKAWFRPTQLGSCFGVMIWYTIRTNQPWSTVFHGHDPKYHDIRSPASEFFFAILVLIKRVDMGMNWWRGRVGEGVGEW